MRIKYKECSNYSNEKHYEILVVDTLISYQHFAFENLEPLISSCYDMNLVFNCYRNFSFAKEISTSREVDSYFKACRFRGFGKAIPCPFNSPMCEPSRHKHHSRCIGRISDEIDSTKNIPICRLYASEFSHRQEFQCRNNGSAKSHCIVMAYTDHGLYQTPPKDRTPILIGRCPRNPSFINALYSRRSSNVLKKLKCVKRQEKRPGRRTGFSRYTGFEV